MNRDYIDLHLLTDRYLQGKLSDSETAAFEERLIWDQALIDELELAERLREGMRAAAQIGGPASTGPTGIIASVGMALTSRYYALAASALLVASVVMNVTLLGGPTTGDSPPIVIAGAPQVVQPLAVRNTEPMLIPLDPSRPVVLLADRAGDFADYRLSLRSLPAGTAVATQDGLTPNYLDTLALSLPAGALADGDYMLSASGRNAGESGYALIYEIPFRTAPTP